VREETKREKVGWRRDEAREENHWNRSLDHFGMYVPSSVLQPQLLFTRD
jgi:hypothetical protein